MQSRWSVVLLSSYTLLLPCSLNSAASYDTKPIPSFIFQRTPIQSVCTEKEEQPTIVEGIPAPLGHWEPLNPHNARLFKHFEHPSLQFNFFENARAGELARR